ncbi:hypothetical protein AX15_003849 [Amanita polypyramis BW_CC]|nr:hypothetical protein AX15_003849 [Amanita polypyramis BW_CC]
MSRNNEALDAGASVTTLAHEPIAGFSSEVLGNDTRIDASPIPNSDKLDLGQTVQISDLTFRVFGQPQSITLKEKPGADQPIYIDFAEGDKKNPANYSIREKWIITFIACSLTFISGVTAGSYNLGISTMIQDLNSTRMLAITGFIVYPLAFAIFPLITASLSEEFGRRPLYIVSQVFFIVMYLMVGFAKNIQTVIVGRFIQGIAGSCGATVVSGTIADIWSAKDRGIPMSVFTLLGVGGAGVGPIIGGWIEMELGWRWIQWIQMMFCSIPAILVLFMKETRPEVLAIRLAKEVRKRTGNNHYRARVEDQRGSLLTLIRVSCTRPVYLLLTEPVVIAFSLWIGFSWGVTYCFLSVITLVFQDLYGFNVGEAGTTYVSLVTGTLLGLITGFYQEYLYRKNVAKRGPEARLYMACLAGVLLPVGLFIFSWTALRHVHWIGINFGIAIFMWATYIIYSTVFSYLSDCYGTWASSASAGQSLLRNLMAAIFPLFSRQMFLRLSFKWAGTLLAFIGVLLMPIPFVLFFWGPAIRKRSKVARKLV